MTLQPRDRRALAYLGVALVLVAVMYFWPASAPKVVAPSSDSIPLAERRLAKAREVAAAVPGKQKYLESLQAQLKEREKGILVADTAAQAQAQLMQLIRKLARAQAPPVELRQLDVGAVQGLGRDYGEVLVTASLSCRIEQLVNLLADITAQPDLIATHELAVNEGDARQKLLNVRLMVSGVVLRKLVPERKGLGAF